MRSLFALVLALCLATPPASDALARSKTHGGPAVTASVPPQGWPPYIVVQQGKPPSGIMLDVLKDIIGSLGYALDIVFYPEVRGRLQVQFGETDAYPEAKEWVENPDAFLWTDPVVNSQDVVVYNAGAPVAYDGPKSLYGLKVGVVHGFGYPTLDAHFQSGDIRAHRVRTTENLMDMLAERRIDCAVTNRRVAEWIIKNAARLQSTRFAFSPTPIDSAPYRFAFTRQGDWEPFISRFNGELARMRADGRLDAILNRYR